MAKERLTEAEQMIDEHRQDLQQAELEQRLLEGASRGDPPVHMFTMEEAAEDSLARVEDEGKK